MKIIILDQFGRPIEPSPVPEWYLKYVRVRGELTWSEVWDYEHF